MKSYIFIDFSREYFVLPELQYLLADSMSHASMHGVSLVYVVWNGVCSIVFIIHKVPLKIEDRIYTTR